MPPQLSIFRFPALLALCLLPACSMIAQAPLPRGNRVEADQLKQLKPGTTSQAEVATLLGSPTAKGTFDQNTWIYVSSVTRPVIAGTQAVLKQSVVELRFDDKGVLRQVQTENLNNALPVTVVARTTPAPGTEASFLQQLFGNVGRFTPGLTQPTAPEGGAPTP